MTVSLVPENRQHVRYFLNQFYTLHYCFKLMIDNLTLVFHCFIIHLNLFSIHAMILQHITVT